VLSSTVSSTFTEIRGREKRAFLLNDRAMEDTPEDSPTLGEQMNRALYLDPGFTADKPTLVQAIRRDIDETTKRAQANVDQQRQNAADVEEIASDMAREAESPDQP
jgi:hypothetical protein